MSRLIGYARVSTSQQSLDTQVQILISTGVDEHRVFTDKATGSNIDRTGLERLLLFLDKRDKVLVTKLDRLGRDTRDMLKIIDQIKAKGASVQFLQDGISTEGAMGEMVITILAAVAQAERARIMERTNEGRTAAKAKGVKFGKKRSIDRKQVIAMKAGGMGVTAIAKALDIGRTQIYQILKEEEHERSKVSGNIQAEHESAGLCTKVDVVQSASNRKNSEGERGKGLCAA